MISLSSNESSSADSIAPSPVSRVLKKRATRSAKPKSYSQNTYNSLLRTYDKENGHNLHSSLTYDYEAVPSDNRRVHAHPKMHKTIESEDSKEAQKLRATVTKLKKTLKKQDNALKDAFNQVIDEGHDLKDLAKQFKEVKTRESLVEGLKGKLATMQQNESKLLAELKHQRKATETLLEKLYGLQTDSAREVQYFKEYYKDHYSSNFGNQVQECKQQMVGVEREKGHLLLEMAQLEKEYEYKLARKSNIENELSELKNQLKQERIENNVLIEEIKDIRAHVKEKEKSRAKEKETLKVYGEQLKVENESLRIKGQEWVKKDFQEKAMLMEKVKSLEEEAFKRERVILQNEIIYKKNIENMEHKIDQLEQENKELAQYQVKVEEIKKYVATKDTEFDNKEKHYTKKIEMAKRVQEQRKKEWSSMYNELLKEVRELKSGMSTLQTENHRLFTSVDSKGLDHYI